MTPVPDSEPELVALVDEVLATKKYRTVTRPVVTRCVRDALRRTNDPADAVKRAKRKLHQIYAAYLAKAPNYGALLRALEQAAASGDDAGLRRALERAMATHASTRERLSELSHFYGELRPYLSGAARVLDLACGLNPLAYPWMGREPQAHYLAWDLDHRLVEFVDQVLTVLGAPHTCETVDLLEPEQVPECDVALLLKLLPCLEQQRSGASRELLLRIPARTLVVSFPLESLGGRTRGMREHYGTGFEALLATEGWSHRRFESGRELVYVVHK